MRYMEFDFARHEPTLGQLDLMIAEFGTAQVPLVRDNRVSTLAHQRCLRDSTSIIEHLGAGAVVPADDGATAFLCALLDDFADEYMWRPAMWSRWAPEGDSAAMGRRWTYEFCRDDPWYVPLAVRPWVLKWRQQLFSVSGEGIATPAQHGAAMQQYLDCMDALNTVLATSPFLLGNKPSVVDFAFTGPFFRHFSTDVTPRKIMEQRAPNVFEWLARMWNAKRSRLDAQSWDPAPFANNAGWAKLWPLLREFLAYHKANAQAWQQGRTSFACTFRGVESIVPVVPFRVWSLDKLKTRFAALNETTRSNVQSFLEQRDAWGAGLLAEAALGASPGEGQGVEPPFCTGRRVPGLYEQIMHGSSPKWPQLPLAMRVLKDKLTSGEWNRHVLALAVFFFLFIRRWRS